MYTPIFINNIQVFRPSDILKIYMAGKDASLLMFYLSTGFRSREGDRFLKQTHNFYPDRNIINFESFKRWDTERIKKDRIIYLTPLESFHIYTFISNYKLDYINPQPTKSKLYNNMKNWFKKTDLDQRGLGVMSTRKTRFVWLLKAYPEYEDIIIKSMDYDPDRNSYINALDDDLDLYKQVRFEEKEEKLVIGWMQGWTGTESQ